MATTTNFGWETPDDTDLVKDGAAAMRTLGNSIDTSFVDLKGGTTGQVLAKASNTDLDYTWTTVSGDIEGVTAGTGISGGGTSGTVTITNSMATAIDAKGDLIAGTGADTFSRLAVGTNNHVLTADSTAATGIKWAAVSSPAFVGCAVTKSADQSIATATTTNITWDTEQYDTDGFHDNSTNNSRFTIPAGLGGKYLVVVHIRWNQGGSDPFILYLDKNGTNTISWVQNAQGEAVGMSQQMIRMVDLVAGDYIQVQARQTAGFSIPAKGAQVYESSMSITRLGA